MADTLRISFALKNTYRVNTILYSLKQVPIIKRVLPDTLYQVKELKILANVISVIWETASAFLGKLLYMLLMIVGAAKLYENTSGEDIFLHILLFLTLIGVFANTYMLNPSRDKYYAMILMRMNAKEYTIVNYGYDILKIVIGFLPFSLIFGMGSHLPVWVCLLIPFSIAGMKITYAALSLIKYERTHKTTSENQIGKLGWFLIGVLLACAYGLPAAGIYVPSQICLVIMGLAVLTGGFAIRTILKFDRYREMYQEILTQSMTQMDDAKELTKQMSQKGISSDVIITSKKTGLEYFNEIFIKRHKKILWKSANKVAIVSLIVVLAAMLLFYLMPAIKEDTNEVLMTFLPYFVFVMYMINRGTRFTSALFMNCDHSMLTYAVYKQPKFVLKLFAIRLREIIKINLLPAVVIGVGLAAILYVSGGTENPLNYLVLVVSILCMSVFFSVHYLTIYYLLQPYNAGTEIKSGTYKIITSGTYIVCYLMMQVRMSTLVFGCMTIIFSVVYCIVACILVYRVAPKTFKLRN
ncbi:MAG: hypothetical protein EOM40_09260 [Clostridia bacterium]|nr:hypothetical protein [Clostridia bacterium]NCC43737.1 hypothetical protein [Clostridia bacterium]